MGRYYNGDIEGKFWFAVQSSDDADFFGVQGTIVEETYTDEDTGEEVTEESNFLGYAFTSEHLPEIRNGVEKCLEALGANKEKIDEFFKNRDSYRPEDLRDFLGVESSGPLLEWYARLDLGMKILKCVEETGGCCFEAEL